MELHFSKAALDAEAKLVVLRNFEMCVQASALCTAHHTPGDSYELNQVIKDF